MSKNIKTFLGANTPGGFCSLFSELYNPYKNSRMYIIKGGPGTGKSSLMKKAAQAAKKLELDTEEIYCSSDPDSLDGLIVPKLGLCIADGTAPHVIEPVFPGATENILNLGQFWNREKMFENADKIRSAAIENSLYHRRSTRYLSAAGAVCEDTQRMLAAAVDTAKIESFAVRFCARETPKIKGAAPGKKSRRFISAISPKGRIFLDDTFKALASRIIGVVDEYAAVSGILMERIAETASKNGYDVIVCPCPMRPKEYEHIIIPQAGLAVITVKSGHCLSIECDRLIHARRFVDEAYIKDRKNRLAFGKKMAQELTDESIELLKKAKAVHDELESFYIEAMDFDSLDSFTEQLIDSEIYLRA